jgi:hypothetical protein
VKTKTIGQCKDCKFSFKQIPGRYDDKCKYKIWDVFYKLNLIVKTFGCWYWKEKK